MIINPEHAALGTAGDSGNTQFVGVRTAKSGHRFYSPSLGRFINEDPIEEQGGLNLYAFCGNNGVNRWDYLGMVDDYMRTRADGSTYFDYGGYVHGSDFVSYKNAGVATDGGSSYGQGVTIGSAATGYVQAGTSLDSITGAKSWTGTDSGVSAGGTRKENIVIHDFTELSEKPAAAPNNSATGPSLTDSFVAGSGALIPGALAYDRMQADIANGNTTSAIVNGVAWIGEQALFVATLGQSATAQSTARVVVGGISNPVPATLARVIPGSVVPSTLGRAGATDVFVTSAADIAGLGPSQISQCLTIGAADTYTIIRFSTPGSGLASPILRTTPGFVGGGRTLGGATEFVVPNGAIPTGATITTIGPGFP